VSDFLTWNERVLHLLEDIRNNGTPQGSAEGLNFRIADQDISDSNPCPISDAGGSITVDGSIDVANFPANQLVSGSVSIDNFPDTQEVSGQVSISNLPATQTVDGSVTVNNFPDTQTVDGAVGVSNLPSQPYLNSEDFGTASAVVVKASAGVVFSICAHNLSSDCKRYLQLHDTSSIPQTGDTPKLFFPVCGGNSWMLGNEYFGLLGRHFEHGIAWAWSNTAKTYSPIQSASEHATFINYQ
jgi:hypothetical protein